MDSPPGVEKATRASPSPSRARTVAKNAPSRAKVAPAGSLRAGGTSVLLVEQSVQKSLAFADRVYALSGGHIVLEASTSEADLPQRLKHAYFGQDQTAAAK